MSMGLTENSPKRVNRAGIWTKDDKKFMEDNHLTMSHEDIAAQISRNPETVKKYIEKFLGHSEPERLSKKANFEIRKSPVWHEVCKQFSDDELDMFEYYWGNLMAQFKQDVLPTERMQMIEVVRLELLLNRLLVKLREVDITVDEAKAEKTTEELKDIEDRDVAKVNRLTIIIAQCYQSHREMNREYKELLERKGKILQEIRGTREQRIKRIEDSKETIQTWMATLADNPDLRRELGIEMKKHQLAMEIELKRLSDYHKFADDSVEQPILNCDTIFVDNE